MTFNGGTYVVISEDEYLRLRVKAGELTEQDLGDIREARRRASQPSRPYSELRNELGLE